MRWRVSYHLWRVRLSNRVYRNAAWVSDLMGGRGVCRGLNPVRSSSRISRFEGQPVRIPHQIQRPGKEAAIILTFADIDNADIDQRACENRLYSSARDRIDEVERVIDHHPSRPLQDDASLHLEGIFLSAAALTSALAFAE